MSLLVEDLLLLARLDQGRPPVREVVDLCPIVVDAVDATRINDRERSITLDMNGPVVVHGDAARLRQIVESNRREADAQMAAALAKFRGDFETAREEALLKCNEELESGVARASHAAVESISRSSEWLQEEARARLQVQVEQTLAAAGAGLAEKTGEAEGKFAAQLEENSSARLAGIRCELDGVFVRHQPFTCE